MSLVEIKDHKAEFDEALESALENALEKVGMVAESYAKALCPVDMGQLRNSISHKVDMGESAVYIGTDIEYAPYVELGTGQYVAGGRPSPWVYQDSSGNWHRTSGQRPQPYLKPTAENYADTYRAIILSELEG